MVKTTEYIVFHEDILVVTGVFPVGNSATHGYHGASPGGGSVHAVVENVVPDRHVTYSGLLVPVTSVSLEKNCRSGSMEGVFFNDHLASGSDQETSGPVVADVTSADEDIWISVVLGYDIILFNIFRKWLCESDFRIFTIKIFNGFHALSGVCFHNLAVDKLKGHPWLDETDSVLPRVAPAEEQLVRGKDFVNCHVPSMDIGGIIFLVLEHAVDHPDVALAIDKMSGVGGDADDPV